MKEFYYADHGRYLYRMPAVVVFYRNRFCMEESAAAETGRQGDRKRKDKKMENRVAMLAIVVEDLKSVEALNHLLHQFSPYIIGRMGVPYKARNISLISVAVDAPADVISTLSGKLGMLRGVTSKAVYSKLPKTEA